MTEPARRLNVEILGTSPSNKGSLLMLEAIREKFHAELPNARLAVPSNWPADQRLDLGLHCTYWRERDGLDRSRWSELVPRGFRQSVGFMAPSDVDVVLDASGFAYGDFWGLQKLRRRLGRVARRWKTDRKTLILLPQAFGPFELPGMASSFQQALRRADLAYVRDRVSMRHVEAAAGQCETVQLSPDFTALLHVDLPARLQVVRGAVLVIPNEKMMAGQKSGRRADYLAFLRLAVEKLSATRRKVVLLVHEGVGDRQLAQELNASLPHPIEVIDEASPRVTKAIIGVAYAAVSSRFHGLVSALSAAVPCLACGWTHKYMELMSEHGCPELNIDLSDRDNWSTKIDLLLRMAQDETMRARIAAAAGQQRDRTEEMWAHVFELLRRRHPEAT